MSETEVSANWTFGPIQARALISSQQQSEYGDWHSTNSVDLDFAVDFNEYFIYDYLCFNSFLKQDKDVVEHTACFYAIDNGIWWVI